LPGEARRASKTPWPAERMIDEMQGPGRARVWFGKYLWAWLALIILLIAPKLTNQYTQYVINLILVYVPVTIGFNIALGNLGQLTFANVAVFGIGAYTAGVLMARAGWPFAAALLPCGIAGAFAGFLASAAALRGVRGLYLAIVTLAFGELMRWLYIHADALTMGSNGLPVPNAALFGVSLTSASAQYYVFLSLATLVVVGNRNLLRSRIGRAIMAIKDNELAAASLGIPVQKYIVMAFAWSGFVVAIGGGMFAIAVGRVVPDSFGLIELIHQFAMVIVGGLGSLPGSILGAAILTAVPEAFQGLPGLEELLLGVLLVIILLFLPRGLISLAVRFVPGLGDRYHRE
jgi:branched-chain amino acid transport system permease protein